MTARMNRFIEPLTVYAGSGTYFALISQGTLYGVQAGVAVVIGIITAFYTILKCVKLWNEIYPKQ
jgi:uncharacterized oligopeptide transporter (OPT) family protein